MKKYSFIVAFLLVLMLISPSQAAACAIGADVELLFSGNTATCSVFITAANSGDDIKAVIELKQGNNCIKTWTESAESVLDFCETVSVTKGKSYTLTVDYTVNGVSCPQASASGTCK